MRLPRLRRAALLGALLLLRAPAAGAQDAVDASLERALERTVAAMERALEVGLAAELGLAADGRARAALDAQLTRLRIRQDAPTLRAAAAAASQTTCAPDADGRLVCRVLADRAPAPD